MSRTLKVLLLDKNTDHLPDLSDRGIIVQVTHEREWNRDVYKAPRESIEKIEQLTAVGNYDIVVVGNNLGAGVLKAMAVHQRLRSRTVVVWNDDRYAFREEYQRLGIRHCITRYALRDYILNLVTN